MEALFGTVKFYTPSTRPKENSFEIHNDHTGLTYYANDGIELDDPDYGMPITDYQGFPFVVNEDGSLWREATLFFIWKIKGSPDITAERLRQYADTLQDFKRFCEHDGIDLLKADFKFSRPNVLYGKHLAKTSAKQWGNKMKVLSAFYKYLRDVRGIRFKVDVLETVKRGMLIATRGGGGFIKEIEINKVDQEAKTQNQQDPEYIRDGEKMRPMSVTEQKMFEEAMLEYSNEELVLGSMIAIATSARKQTVYTLRLKHFVDSLPVRYDTFTLERWLDENMRHIRDDESKKIMVGDGTKADTKNGKRFYITFDGWLFKAIISYIVSERARQRRDGALSQNSDLDQYLFLSMHHHPIYHAKDDINLYAWKETHGGKSNKGNSIDQAMKRFRDEVLWPRCVEKKMKRFDLRFHDFRATYAMRYLDRNEAQVDGKAVTWGTVIRQLANIMAHESAVTTQRYLDVKHLSEQAPVIQFDWEKERMNKIRGRANYTLDGDER